MALAPFRGEARWSPGAVPSCRAVPVSRIPSSTRSRQPVLLGAPTPGALATKAQPVSCLLSSSCCSSLPLVSRRGVALFSGWGALFSSRSGPEPSAGDTHRSVSPPGGTCLTARGPARPAARPTRLLWTRVRTQPARVSCRGSCTCVDAFSCRKAVLFPRDTQPMCFFHVQLCLHLPTCKSLAIGLIPFMIISCYGASYR